MKNSRSWPAIGVFCFALMATLGSLYYSNIGDPLENISLSLSTGDWSIPFTPGYGFDPCNLCWWARIFMYPIVPISAVGIIKKDNSFFKYITPLVLAGIPLEIYHYVLQKTNITNGFACTGANPCSAMSVNYAGFITIPLLCLIAFTLIGVSIVMHYKQNKKEA